MTELSVLSLSSDLSDLILQNVSLDREHIGTELNELFKTRLKKKSFEKLLKFKRRQKKVVTASEIVFECVMRCEKPERQLFSSLLVDYLSQLNKISGLDADTIRSYMMFLSCLQNSSGKMGRFDPQHCLALSIVSKSAKSDMQLERFFSYSRGWERNITKIETLVECSKSSSSLERFFIEADKTKRCDIYTRTRAPLQSESMNPGIDLQELDEGFCGDKDDLQLVSSDADCTSDGSHWVSQWHGVDFGAPKLRSTWDQFGQLEPTSELSFASDNSCLLKCLDGVRFRSVDYVSVPEDILIVHCLNVLVAVPSSTFLFHISDMEYSVRSNVKVSTLTPATLQEVLREFATCGTCFERLSFFCQHSKGLFISCLASQIQKLLRIIHGLVVELFDRRGSLNMLKLDSCTKSIRRLATFLMGIISGCSQGDQVLSYLYQKCLESTGSPFYKLMTHLFKACSQPYMDLIQHWIYHGLPQDHSTIEEFFITGNVEFLSCRNRSFWTKAITLNTDERRSNVPMFLRGHIDDVFTCGKTIMMIKACQPYHYMVSNYLSSPRLTVTFDPSEVGSLEREAEMYCSQLDSLVEAETLTREEQEAEETEAKQRIQAELRRAATKEFEDLAKRLLEQSESTRIRRATELLQLRDEMEASLARKTELEREERERDRERMRLGVARDEEELQRMQQIEQQARAELIAYYEELSAEATKREQRALWRIKRHQLDEKRRESWELMKHDPLEGVTDLHSTFQVQDDWANTSKTEKVSTNDLQDVSSIGNKTEDKLVTLQNEDKNQGKNDEIKPAMREAIEKEIEQLSDNGVQSSSFSGRHTSEDSQISTEISSRKQMTGERTEEQNSPQNQESQALDILSSKNGAQLTQDNESEMKSDSDQELNESVLDPKTLSEVTSPSLWTQKQSNVHDAEENRKKVIGVTSDEGTYKPLIRVGIAQNADSKDMLSWPEDERSALTKSIKNQMKDENAIPEKVFELSLLPTLEWEPSQSYIKEYPELSDEPLSDIAHRVVTAHMHSELTSEEKEIDHLKMIVGLNVNSHIDHGKSSEQMLIPLPVLMQRLLVQPLRRQLSLANKCARRLFLEDYKLKLHFEALRRSLLLADPEFAHALCSKLFPLVDSSSDNWFHKPVGEDVAISLTPFLRSVNFAVERCLWDKKDLLFERLGVRLRPSTEFLDPYQADCFSILTLSYCVDWPVNVIISDSCLHKYLKLFHFLLTLRRLSHVLTSLYFQLKHTQQLFDITGSKQFSKLQYSRHLMQHLVNVMSDYVQDQLLNVSHLEFEKSFEKANSVDDMSNAHAEYLNNMLSRALLTGKSAKVMKMLMSMLAQVIQFQRQLTNGAWSVSGLTGLVEHSNFTQLMATYHKFHSHLSFTIKVVTALAQNGYQPHLDHFLLKLNFNAFFSAKSA
ncbi:gamma-tubulin complex component 6-like isoform X2 [Symsagittifera roscoffensis]|uniref:gamma-tubulin complex component 6-like isoform X2 n=1 Tax=Symsagittifera roscoffensis TaxID=84072 RepID=UPI00307C0AC8